MKKYQEGISLEDKETNIPVANELNDEQLNQVAGGLISADDEVGWKAAFPSDCKMCVKYRSCAISGPIDQTM